MGRPVEFDSEVADNNTMENAFGNIVRPTKLSTCCPTCGQGLLFDVYLADPPFQAVNETCHLCNPPPEVPSDPFMNPVEEGRIPEHDLDPLLHDPAKQIVQGNDESSVADRLKAAEEESKEATKKTAKKATESSKKASEKKETKKASKTRGTKKKSKKTPPKPPVNKNAAKEPAQGMGGEEQDLDDLVETE